MYKVKLNIFEGPLDLLLYLIRKNEMDIYNIPIAEITDQYIEYINLMQSLDLDIAGEFLLMAATLLQMKSEALLPSGVTSDFDEPMMTREELVRQLLEYKKFRDAAIALAYQEEYQRNIYFRSFRDPIISGFDLKEYKINVTLFDLLSAFSKILKSLPEDKLEGFQQETFTVQQKIEEILQLLSKRKRVEFSIFLSDLSTRLEIIVTFLAILELAKSKRIIIRQSQLFGGIWLYPALKSES
ncbi:MAG: segregation and condensation protein A [Candidatus Poribacteria bacterium]